MTTITQAQRTYDSQLPPEDGDYQEWLDVIGFELARDFVFSNKAIPGIVTTRAELLENCEDERDKHIMADLFGGPQDAMKTQDTLLKAMVEAAMDMIEDNAESCFNVWRLKQRMEEG